MLMEILAWVTVIGLPVTLVALIIYGIFITVRRRNRIDAPSPLQEMNVENKIPEWTSIDEESFLRDDMEVDNNRLVDPGTRVWRIYRSIDRIHWVECDPASTERAACNYADYIKRSNPEEFVRCNDPNGVILFYE